MKPEKPPGRWSTYAPAWDRLLHLLNLQDHPGLDSQDPELMLADPTRVAEFCDLYESERIDDGMRLILMELIIFSLDDAYRDMEVEGAEPETAQRVERLLRNNFVRHFYVIRYWYVSNLTDEETNDPEYGFYVTPMMRSIWKDCFKPEYQPWIREAEGE
jgi:hypothetical protein